MRDRPWLPLTVALLTGAALGLTQLGSLDLPLMLANGAVILDTGAIPRTNVFSWVNHDHAYLNDKWLFMVLVAGVYRVGGVMALSVLKAALGAALGGLLYLLARRGARRWPAAGLAALGLTMFSYRLHLRAEWISYLGAAAIFLLIPRVIARDRRAIALTIAIVPVWAGFHGFWYLGPLLVFAAAAGERDLRTAGVGVAALLAACISPFGVHNLLHPANVLLQISGGLAEAITELRAPFVSGGPFTFFHALSLVLAAIGVVLLVGHLRRREWRDAVLLALLLAISLRIDRNLAMLGLVPALATRFPRLGWGGLLAVVAFTGTALGVRQVSAVRALGVGWHEGRHPMALTDGMRERGDEGHYVNDLSIGSFLVFARGEAFIDGNTEGYSSEFLAAYRRMLEGEIVVSQIEATYRPDGYLLRHGARTTSVVILGLFLTGDHAPVEWDEVATQFRSDVAPEEVDELWRRWLEEVYLEHASAFFPTPEQAHAAALEQAGGDESLALRRAVELNPYHRPFYEGLLHHYRKRRDFDLAARCMRYAERLPEVTESSDPR